MATKGTFAAYKPLTGVGEQTSRNIQQAEYMGFRYRREEQERKARKNQWIDKVLEQTGAAREDLRYKNVGIEGVDVPVAQFLMKEKETLNNLENNLLDADPNSDEAIQSRMKLSRLNNSVKDLKGFVDFYRERNDAFDPEKHSRYLFKEQTAEINNRLQQGKYNLFRDKNYNMMMAFYDEDGEINPDLPVLNVSEVNKKGLPPLPAKVTRKEAMTNIASEFGTISTEEDLDGNVTETYTGFDPKNIPALRERVDEIFGDTKKTMTPAAKSMLADDIGFTDFEDMSENEFNKLKTDFADAIVRRFDKTEKTTIDRSLSLQQERFRYQKQRDATEDAREDAKNAKEEPPRNTIEVMTGEQGSSNASGTTLFSLPEAATLDTGGGIVKTFQVQMQGDELNFRGNMTTGTGKDKTTSPQTITRDDQKNVIVRQIPNPETGKNFSNLSEFKQYLDKLKQGQTNTEAGYGNPEELPDFNP